MRGRAGRQALEAGRCGACRVRAASDSAGSGSTQQFAVKTVSLPHGDPAALASTLQVCHPWIC